MDRTRLINLVWKYYCPIFACILLSACTSTPSPSIDFGAVTIPEVTATPAVSLPIRPQLIECKPGFACLTESELDVYEAWTIVAEANVDIAIANGEAVNNLNIATQKLVEAGKQAGHLHELREDQLKWRISEKQKDLFTAWGVIVILGLALAF